MALDNDREFEIIVRKTFIDPLVNDTTSVDVVDDEGSELSKIKFFSEWYLWYVLIVGCGPWEAQFSVFHQCWHEYDKESFDEYFSNIALQSIGGLQLSEAIYELIRIGKILRITSQSYFQNFIRPPSEFFGSVDKLKIDSQYDLLE